MRRYTLRLHGLLLLTCAAAIPTGSLLGQEDSSRAIIERLLAAGEREHENRNYSAADSMAREALRNPLLRAERARALLLSAAALFPRSHVDQHEDSALTQLRALIRFAPTASPRRAISWPGLDSLLAMARRTTFGLEASARDSVTIEGASGAIPIYSQTTLPAQFRLLLVSRLGGAPVVVDSSGPATAATLRFQPVMEEQPRFPSGEYVATIEATNVAGGEVLTSKVAIELYAPSFVLNRVPMTWDRKNTKPVRMRPARTASVLSGIMIGAFTAFAVRAKPPEELATGPSPNSRASSWGIGLGVITAVGSWLLDEGRALPENVVFNDNLQREWLATQTKLLADNRERQASYRGYAKMRMEDK